MATSKQVKANKKNAQKSTGPLTDTGKAVSSRNALSHGLTAEHHLLSVEEETQFQHLLPSMAAEWLPVTETEKLLLERIAHTMIRLRRVPAIEVAILKALSQPRGVSPGTGTQASKIKTGQAAASAAREPVSEWSIGEALELAFTKSHPDKLMRYEAGLMKHLSGTYDLLRRSISDRKQQAEAATKKEKPLPAPLNAAEAFDKMTLG